MVRTERTPSRSETTVSWTIMGALCLIAIGVFIKQYHYDPTPILSVSETSEYQATGSQLRGLTPKLDLADYVPDDMGVLAPPESFSPRTLSEKINGKAELYLSAGFVSLLSERFSRNADPQSWMEVFVYDMGKLRQAFAVFSAQRRAHGQALNLTPFSYTTSNAIFFVRGRYYVEVIASIPTKAMRESMLHFAENFVRWTSVDAEELNEMRFFPTEHLIEASHTVYISNAFGFNGMDNVFAARYNVQGEELTAFLSKRQTPHEAQKLVESYKAFLITNGGTGVPLSTHIDNATFVEILDTFELIFCHQQYVAGIRGAETLQAAEKLALLLKNKLEKAL